MVVAVKDYVNQKGSQVLLTDDNNKERGALFAEMLMT